MKSELEGLEVGLLAKEEVVEDVVEEVGVELTSSGAVWRESALGNSHLEVVFNHKVEAIHASASPRVLS